MAVLKRFRRGTKNSKPPRPDADGVTYRPLEPLDDRVAGWRTVIEDDRQRTMYDRVAASVDREAYAALQERYRGEVEANDQFHFTKYLDLAPWFMIHSRLARLLDIDTRPACSILDIGAGGGQFLAIAQCYGHDVTAFDQSHPAVYGDLMKLFGIDRVEGGVRYGEPLPDGIGRYDLVVINGQIFDTRLDRTRWDLTEWASFLEYLCAEHINAPGNLFIGLNKSVGPTETEDYLWPLIEWGAAHGASVERNRATMDLKFDTPPTFDDVPHVPWLSLDDDSTKAAQKAST